VYGGNSEKSVLNFAYTGKAQSVTLEPGKYVLECWGAQGGYRSNSSYGGKGGYSTGTLTLTQKTTIYIYVGGSGNSVTSASSLTSTSASNVSTFSVKSSVSSESSVKLNTSSSDSSISS